MSHTPYRHSVAFAKLKRIQETIPNNLTSVEYLKTLDFLLENALLPILVSTRFVDSFLSKILAWQSKNPKRKTTAEGKKSLPSYVVLYLISSSPEQKHRIYNKIGFDRGITMEIIRRWLELMGQYEAIINQPELSLEDMRRARRILTKLGANEEEYPYGAYLQVRFWFDKASYFKSLILEKYTRLCLNTAQQDYVKFHHKIELEDIMQVYLMTASKAIDRCNADKGVLTSYIQNWLMSARNVVVKNYLGESEKTVLANTYEQVDKFIQDRVEPVSLEETAEEKEDRVGVVDRVRMIAKFFDPTGYARLLMGVGEYITPRMERELKGNLNPVL
jgi:hypothetical protein